MMRSNVLSEAERCDRCSARAYVRVLVGQDSFLDYCGHHFGTAEPEVRRRGYTILDERWRLDPAQVERSVAESRPRYLGRRGSR